MSVRHPLHGTISGYRNDDCRCPACRAANTEQTRAERAARRARGAADPTVIPHGTSGGYQNWGCRCTRCSAAQTLDHLDWYATKHPAEYTDDDRYQY